MCVGRAHEIRVRLSHLLDVIGVAAFASNEPTIFLARNTLSDAFTHALFPLIRLAPSMTAAAIFW